jgi:hypothetical protein
MSQQKLLEKVIRTLDEFKIEYMVTGSLVSSLQGEPRLTHDIDLVVAIQLESVAKLAASFSPQDYYLDEESIYDAIKRRGMFNLIDIKEGDKVDFWLLTDELFDFSRFSRKYIVEFMGIKLQVSSPEDTILAKLRWAKLSGGSEKQFTDALRVYEVQFHRLDMDYLERWVKKLDVETLWKRLKAEADELSNL